MTKQGRSENPVFDQGRRRIQEDYRHKANLRVPVEKFSLSKLIGTIAAIVSIIGVLFAIATYFQWLPKNIFNSSNTTAMEPAAAENPNKK